MINPLIIETYTRSCFLVLFVALICFITGTLISCREFKPGTEVITPVDGDMLCEYDGNIINENLLVTVKVHASKGARIRINEIKAKYSGSLYQAEIPLENYRNLIEVEEKRSGEKQSITVFRLKNHTAKYRLSLDDNIWFLKDISVNSATYKSIFENPYLSFLKEVHDTYGTRIHINIYYQTDGFNLSQMTDKFKEEWKKNAEWLRLSFHALQNDPDMPYKNSGYDEVKRDCELVRKEIRRFAGDELMDRVTTLHWGEATKEGCRALRDSGYDVLAGYFSVDTDQYPVSYYLNAEQREYVNKRFVWRDNNEGIIFSRIGMVINSFELDQIIPTLNGYLNGQHKPGFMDLMIHEQYFYPFYINYQPDFREKVLTAVKWATDNGYKPAFLSEYISDKN